MTALISGAGCDAPWVVGDAFLSRSETAVVRVASSSHSEDATRWQTVGAQDTKTISSFTLTRRNCGARRCADIQFAQSPNLSPANDKSGLALPQLAQSHKILQGPSIFITKQTRIVAADSATFAHTAHIHTTKYI